MFMAAQKYRLYLKRLAGYPSSARLPLDTLQQVQQAIQAQGHPPLFQEGGSRGLPSGMGGLHDIVKFQLLNSGLIHICIAHLWFSCMPYATVLTLPHPGS